MPTRDQKKLKSKPVKSRAAGKSPAAGRKHPQRKRPEARTARPALSRKVEPNPSRVDVVGKLPPDIHVDPEITEGHRAYDETGPSEIIQPDA